MSNLCSIVCSKMWWSIGYKGALRANKTRIEISPSADTVKRSLVTFTNALSVQWWSLKPDWKSSKRLPSWRNLGDSKSLYRSFTIPVRLAIIVSSAGAGGSCALIVSHSWSVLDLVTVDLVLHVENPSTPTGPLFMQWRSCLQCIIRSDCSITGLTGRVTAQKKQAPSWILTL